MLNFFRNLFHVCDDTILQQKKALTTLNGAPVEGYLTIEKCTKCAREKSYYLMHDGKHSVHLDFAKKKIQEL